MTLGVQDLFTLFNAACQRIGAPGYSGSSNLQTQSALTIKAWTEFHRVLSGYWPTGDARGVPLASKKAADYTTDDNIRRAIDSFDDAAQKRLYEVLYNMGHRINR